MASSVRQASRLIAGFLGAPLVSGILWSIMTLDPAGGIFALIFAYPFAWILGIPCYLFFGKFGWIKLWQVALAGAILGGLAFCIFYLSGITKWSTIDLTIGDLLLIGVFVLHGTAIAATFWFIGIKPRKFDVA